MKFRGQRRRVLLGHDRGADVAARRDRGHHARQRAGEADGEQRVLTVRRADEPAVGLGGPGAVMRRAAVHRTGTIGVRLRGAAMRLRLRRGRLSRRRRAAEPDRQHRLQRALEERHGETACREVPPDETHGGLHSRGEYSPASRRAPTVFEAAYTCRNDRRPSSATRPAINPNLLRQTACCRSLPRR